MAITNGNTYKFKLHKVSFPITLRTSTRYNPPNPFLAGAKTYFANPSKNAGKVHSIVANLKEAQTIEMTPKA